MSFIWEMEMSKRLVDSDLFTEDTDEEEEDIHGYMYCHCIVDILLI